MRLDVLTRIKVYARGTPSPNARGSSDIVLLYTPILSQTYLHHPLTIAITTTTMASSSESTPLLPTTKPIPPKPSRTVTFNPTISSSSPPTRRPPINPTTSTSNIPRDGTQPMLSALNSKLRRRNSSGAPLTPVANLPKIGPQRTTRTAQKLKLLPDAGEDYEDQESGREVYSQFTRIKDPTARRDAARLGKDDRAKLPRVTAYCTASSYRLEEAMRWLKGRGKIRGWKEQGGGVGALGGPKLFDECIYSPYSYRKERDGSKERRRNGSVRVEEEEVQSQPIRRFSDSAIEVEENAERRREDLIDLQASQQSTAAETPTSSSTDLDTSALDIETSALDLAVPAPISLPERAQTPDFDTTIHVPEIFLFDYGVCVLWGLTLAEEQRFLLELAKLEVEKLGVDDVQTEEFNFYYTREYQARIYNDFIRLREKRNYMTKLAISHALAQSTKVCLLKPPLLYSDLWERERKTTMANMWWRTRLPSTKTSSPPPSRRPNPSRPPSRLQAASTSPVARSTCKSASSLSCALTSISRVPCSMLRN